MAELKNFTVYLWGWDKWPGTSIFIIKWIILNDAIVSKSSDFLEIKTLKKEEKKVMVHLMTYYMWQQLVIYA